MKRLKGVLIAVALGHALALPLGAQVTGALNQPEATSGIATNVTLDLRPHAEDIWVDGSVGKGFRPGFHEAGFSLGGGFGTHELGGVSPHDMVLARVYCGWVLGKVRGGDSWYRGNWELVQELFGGAQTYPGTRYVIGETTVFRYNFATGTRWVPFVDVGAGITATDIGQPDLALDFEFNLQAGPGVNYFWRRNCALTLQYRFIHLSCASIKTPNQGVNENVLYAGISWFF
jgi:hypothetical protein